jgi:hypothetical protein
MGFKKITGPIPLFTAEAVTGTNMYTSPAIQIQNLDNLGIQVSWTGTPTGTISVLCSIDGINYIPLTFSPALSQPAGSAGSYLINLEEVPFPFLELQYINASGSGTLSALFFGKDIN